MTHKGASVPMWLMTEAQQYLRQQDDMKNAPKVLRLSPLIIAVARSRAITNVRQRFEDCRDTESLEPLE